MLYSTDVQYMLVKAVPTYKCDGCGILETGSTVRIERNELVLISAASIPASSIPVGWACYGRERTLCPRCKR